MSYNSIASECCVDDKLSTADAPVDPRAYEESDEYEDW